MEIIFFKKFKKKNVFLRLFILFGFFCLLGGCTGETFFSIIAWDSFYSVFVGLFAGFVFFLMGMEIMTSALKNYAGGNLRRTITGLTKHRIRGFGAGALISALVQSNSAATVMVVGFVQAGLVKFSASLAVILGANVGATVTTQIIAFSIFEYAVFFIGSGFFLKIFSKKIYLKNIGNTLIGFGLLFYGMDLMSQAVLPLRENPDAIVYIEKFSSPLFALFTGLFFTAVIQSSNASTGIAMVMAEGGLISVKSGICLMMGANIGTCVTAVLACIGASRQAKRTALGHLFFKTCGALIFFTILDHFVDFSYFITDSFSDSPSRTIANAHTFYNLGIAVIFLPFTVPISRFLTKLFPEKKTEDEISFETILDPESSPPAGAALELARNEISRSIGVLLEMVRGSTLLFVKEKLPMDKRFPSKNILEGICIREREIDFLEKKISDYLFRVVRNDISREKVARAYAYISIAKDVENISDLIRRTIPVLYDKRKNSKTGFSERGENELAEFQLKTVKQISRLKKIFDEPDFESAAKIMRKEKAYLDLHMKYRTSHLIRIAGYTKESLETHKLHMGLMNLMIQLITYTGNIAKTFLEMPEITRKMN